MSDTWPPSLTHYVGDSCPGGHITPDEVAELENFKRRCLEFQDAHLALTIAHGDLVEAAKRHLRENSADSWRALNAAIGPEPVKGRAD